MYASDLYGTRAQLPNMGVAAPTQGLTPSWHSGTWKDLVDPHNPLVFFGVVLLVTIGAAGVAGSVRLGGAKFSVGLGKRGDGDG